MKKILIFISAFLICASVKAQINPGAFQNNSTPFRFRYSFNDSVLGTPYGPEARVRLLGPEASRPGYLFTEITPTDTTLKFWTGLRWKPAGGASTLQQIFDAENRRAELTDDDSIDLNGNRFVVVDDDAIPLYLTKGEFQSSTVVGANSSSLIHSYYGFYSQFSNGSAYARMNIDMLEETGKSIYKLTVDSMEMDFDMSAPLSLSDSAYNYQLVIDKATGRVRAAHWQGGSGSGGKIDSLASDGAGNLEVLNSAGEVLYYVDTRFPTVEVDIGTGSTQTSLIGALADGYGANAFGDSAGNTVDLSSRNNDYSNFFGYRAGYGTKYAATSNFFGNTAGENADSAYASNFFGNGAGQNARLANSSNFFGFTAGQNARYARNSNFFGSGAGMGADSALNSIFIGERSGWEDEGMEDSLRTKNGAWDYSILLGRYTATGGYKNSILLGGSITEQDLISNTADNQFMLAPNITKLRFNSYDYDLAADTLATLRDIREGGGGSGGFFTSSSSTGNTTQDGEGDVFRLVDVSEFGIRATSSGSLDRFRIDASGTVMVSNEGNAFITANDGNIDLDAATVTVPIRAGSGDRYAGYNSSGQLIEMPTPGGGVFDGILELGDSPFGLIKPNDSTYAIDTADADLKDWITDLTTPNLIVQNKGTGKNTSSDSGDTLYTHRIDEGYGVNITKSVDSTNVVSVDSLEIAPRGYVDRVRDSIRAEIADLEPGGGPATVTDSIQVVDDYSDMTGNVAIDTARKRFVYKIGSFYRYVAYTDSAVVLTQLATPGSFTATTIDDDEIGLTWTDVANETNYEIYRNTVNTFGTATLINSPAANATSYTSTGLSASTQYYYWILAVGDGVAYSNSSTATTSATTDAAMDSDAQAFITAWETAAGSSMPSGHKTAFNTYVLGLKSNSLWSIFANGFIYPFYGGTAATNAVALKGTNLTFFGTPTQSSSGTDWDGTDDYATTGWAPASNLPGNNFHLSYWSGEDISSSTRVDIGATTTSGTRLMNIRISQAATTFNGYGGHATPVTGTASNRSGLFLLTRTSATALSAYRNGTLIATETTSNSTAPPTHNIYIGALNSNGTAASFTPRLCKFASAGLEMDATQQGTFYTLTNTLISALGK